jgi:hypothetical protein
MEIAEIVTSQYLASLAMLRAAIEQCPASLWDRPADRNRFWQVAYHALFYTHLYAQPDEAAFTPWEKQRENYHFMGALPGAQGQTAEIEESYTPHELLEYVSLLQAQLPETIAGLDLEAPSSGFDWIALNKLELQFYSIRHLQHHAGELCDRLGREAGIDVGWIGRVHGA